MKNIINDLRAEWKELADFAERLDDGQLATQTDFHGWTCWDEIAHLCFFEGAALLSVQGDQAFKAHLDALMPRLAGGEQISAIARQVYELMPGPELVRRWRAQCERLAGALESMEPNARLPWYGPAMGARSFASARLMEAWAHGQDIYDALRIARPASRRLRHIAHMGVATFGWSFTNRKLAAPGPQPYVCLAAPDGGEWTWGEPSAEHCVRGPAQDFCLVVTQRCHAADTALDVRGEAAQAWMAIAQCFAGPAADRPAPGVRRWN
jgi:uncharacterized protein (TIGR03084 family)